MTAQVVSQEKVDEDLVVEIAGPYVSVSDVHYLIVNGCRVPYVEMWKRDDGTWSLTVDGRFGGWFTKEEILKFGYVLANAMAVSAGFTHHGPDSQPMNRHSCGDKDILR